MSTTAEDRAQLIDEAGELHERLAPFKKDSDRLEAIRKTMRQWADDDKAAAGDTVPYSGTTHQVVLGKKKNERRIERMVRVLRALGARKFIRIVKITLKDLEKALGPAAAQFIVEDQTGPRDVTISRIPAK